VTSKGSIFLDTVRTVISNWVVLSGLLFAVFSDVCVWMHPGMWSTGCLCLQLPVMAVIAVAAEYWISNRKQRSFKDAEFGTTGRE
jgi:hypothetical protein